jgi:hypothetical protein
MSGSYGARRLFRIVGECGPSLGPAASRAPGRTCERSSDISRVLRSGLARGGARARGHFYTLNFFRSRSRALGAPGLHRGSSIPPPAADLS